MGWVLMSERDVQRIEVLTEVLAGKRTVASAAIVAGDQRETSWPTADPVSGGRRRRSGPQGSRPVFEPQGRRRRSGLCFGAGEDQVCRLRPDARDRDAARQARHQGGVVRRCGPGWWRLGCGFRASSAGAFTSRGCGASLMASWSRSTAATTAGSRTAR